MGVRPFRCRLDEKVPVHLSERETTRLRYATTARPARSWACLDQRGGLGRTRLLTLQDPERVAVRVNDPRGAGKADVGDSVDRLQARQVVVLDLHAACAEILQLSLEVVHV